MDSVPRYFSVYRMFVANQMKTLMIYRADFIVGVICLLLSFIAIRFSIWAIFERTQNIGGWVKADILFTYGYNLVASGVGWFFFNQSWGLRDAVVSGGFLKYKIRPIDPLFHFFGESIDLRSFITILLGLATVHGASTTLELSWSASRMAEMALLVCLSSALLAGLIVFASAMAFWFTISNPLLGFLASMYGVAHFPLGIYGKPMQVFLSTLVPIAFLSFYPCSILLGKMDSRAPMYGMAAIVCVVWLVATTLWRRGVRRYELSGT